MDARAGLARMVSKELVMPSIMMVHEANKGRGQTDQQTDEQDDKDHGKPAIHFTQIQAHNADAIGVAGRHYMACSVPV